MLITSKIGNALYEKVITIVRTRYEVSLCLVIFNSKVHNFRCVYFFLKTIFYSNSEEKNHTNFQIKSNQMKTIQTVQLTRNEKNAQPKCIFKTKHLHFGLWKNNWYSGRRRQQMETNNPNRLTRFG